MLSFNDMDTWIASVLEFLDLPVTCQQLNAANAVTTSNEGLGPAVASAQCPQTKGRTKAEFFVCRCFFSFFSKSDGFKRLQKE